MGEVYRARDTTLGREVALKVLPDSVAQDSERIARFRREAQMLAALNHPLVGAIYGLEEYGSAPAPVLVLELIEGRYVIRIQRDGRRAAISHQHLSRAARGPDFAHSESARYRAVSLRRAHQGAPSLALGRTDLPERGVACD